MTIGDKIKSIRELKNYTQEYVAEKLEMTQAGYSKIEKGKTNLTMEKLVQLAAVLGVSIVNIINFESGSYFKVRRDDKKNDRFSEIGFDLIKELYEDKIELLEKLLGKTDQELQFYKEKYGVV